MLIFSKRAGEMLARVCLVMSAACLMTLMVLTVCEVIGRYGFNAPIFGRQDISKILLAASIFLAFPVVTLRGEQIDVDLLDTFFSKTAAFWRDQFIGLLTATGLITMGVWIFHRAEKSYSRGNTSEMLSIPTYPVIFAIATIVFCTGILVAAVTLRRILARVRGTHT
ncbi:MAG: TRAP transporter small permease [Pseudoruegeria sp.]